VPVVEISDGHNDADFSLSPRALEMLWEAEDRHFWHSARNAWIVSLLRSYGEHPPRTILDVGCGSGAVARKLTEYGYAVTGVDTERRLVTKASERCPETSFVLGSVAELPKGLHGPYDVVAFFDVLEHLEFPEEILKAALRWAKPGALVIATVPALKSLHSIVDDLSGHKRRYELGELTRMFDDLGLRHVAEHGIFRSSLALIKRHRASLDRHASQTLTPEQAEQIMCKNLRVPSAPINAAMKLVCSVERRFWLRASRGRVGASIVATGRCPDQLR
jgi:SAM-dependent methyltransferase